MWLIYTNPRPSEHLIMNFYETGLYRLFYESVNPDDDLLNKLTLDDLSKNMNMNFQIQNLFIVKQKKYYPKMIKF